MSHGFNERQLPGSMLLGGGGVSAALKAGVRSYHDSEVRHSLIHDAMVDASIDARGCVDAATPSTLAAS
jgi:hypothetical protein